MAFHYPRASTSSISVAVVVASVCLVGCFGLGTSRVQRRSRNRRLALAAQAYVWGLPLVVSMRTAQMFSTLVGIDHLVNQSKLTGPGPQIVVAPNVDTLYSVAVLDLRRGPEILTVPGNPRSLLRLSIPRHVHPVVCLRRDPSHGRTGRVVGYCGTRVAWKGPGWRLSHPIVDSARVSPRSISCLRRSRPTRNSGHDGSGPIGTHERCRIAWTEPISNQRDGIDGHLAGQ